LITKSLGIKSSRELPYWITVEVLPIILRGVWGSPVPLREDSISITRSSEGEAWKVLSEPAYRVTSFVPSS
jgi:hypothetical protein